MSSEFDGPVVWESPSPKSNPMNLNLGTVGIVIWQEILNYAVWTAIC